MTQLLTKYTPIIISYKRHVKPVERLNLYFTHKVRYNNNILQNKKEAP